ncbi:hypothetical protein CLV78_101433 [Aliiruegeria haliotis]|uniref:Thioredoxin-like fold domain-containing protein n=1 Tax=Aliiruegeria haliotis TaxID=1280846 RepID=A0A2T0RYU3_9RHOB|nr:thioredoxin fold domain-containing protein [Aliiruegeria haliotis]PRY26338.1 hypothetical protein CLV78_101433 [Aliiruegeria haliotis]
MRPIPLLPRGLLVSAAFALAPCPALSEDLVMIEQAGCHYCAQWNAEIAPIYPKTSEGAFAPLRRVTLGSDEMDALMLARRVNFTPTFVIVDDAGQELARLEGYPGEDFFWSVLQQLLVEATDYTPDP